MGRNPRAASSGSQLQAEEPNESGSYTRPTAIPRRRTGYNGTKSPKFLTKADLRNIGNVKGKTPGHKGMNGGRRPKHQRFREGPNRGLHSRGGSVAVPKPVPWLGSGSDWKEKDNWRTGVDRGHDGIKESGGTKEQLGIFPGFGDEGESESSVSPVYTPDSASEIEEEHVAILSGITGPALDIDEFAQTREDDDLFDNNFTPIAIAESTVKLLPESEVPAPEPEPEPFVAPALDIDGFARTSDDDDLFDDDFTFIAEPVVKLVPEPEIPAPEPVLVVAPVLDIEEFARTREDEDLFDDDSTSMSELVVKLSPESDPIVAPALEIDEFARTREDDDLFDNDFTSMAKLVVKLSPEPDLVVVPATPVAPGSVHASGEVLAVVSVAVMTTATAPVEAGGDVQEPQALVEGQTGPSAGKTTMVNTCMSRRRSEPKPSSKKWEGLQVERNDLESPQEEHALLMRQLIKYLMTITSVDASGPAIKIQQMLRMAAYETGDLCEYWKVVDAVGLGIDILLAATAIGLSEKLMLGLELRRWGHDEDFRIAFVEAARALAKFEGWFEQSCSSC